MNELDHVDFARLLDQLRHILLSVEEIKHDLSELAKVVTPKPPETQGLKIVHIERGETRNSSQPKWTLTADTGERLWIIWHPDPTKDSTGVWREYPNIWTHLTSMLLYDEIKLDNEPLEIIVEKRGAFWSVLSVRMSPDKVWQPAIIRPQMYSENFWDGQSQSD